MNMTDISGLASLLSPATKSAQGSVALRALSWLRRDVL